jgi:hypothetical protein
MVVLIVKSTWIDIWIFIDLHLKWFNWLMTFPQNCKNSSSPRLTCKVSRFHLHVKFTRFNFLTHIFGIFSYKHKITTKEELSPQHSQRVGSYEQFQARWTDSPKSSCNSMGPLYIDISTPVFVMRTLDSTYIEFKYVKWSTYIKFQVRM